MYAAPSYPFFILALAAFCWPGVMRLQARYLEWATRDRNYHWAVGGFAALLVLAGIVSIQRYGVVTRDRELLSDIARIQAVVPAHSIIAAPQELRQDYVLQAYLSRLHYVSLDFGGEARAYYLTSTMTDADGKPDSAPAATVRLHKYHLFVEVPDGNKRR
jgi:hypothetical protein